MILVAACAITACKKSNVTPGLAGRWELHRTSGGWVADSIYTAGNGNILQFYGNNTYKKFTASHLSTQGTFHITGDISNSGSGGAMIYFGSDTYGTPVMLHGSTLTLGTSVADGVQSDYQKISN